MDVAASEFLTEDKKYDLDFKTPKNDGSKKLTGNLTYTVVDWRRGHNSDLLIYIYICIVCVFLVLIYFVYTIPML